MGIYIPGMEMPCEGLMTIIAIGYDGRVFQPIEYPDEHTLYHGTKYTSIELPPHGDLVDRDHLSVVCYTGTEGLEDTFDNGVAWTLEYIDKLTPVIPAEEE